MPWTNMKPEYLSIRMETENAYHLGKSETLYTLYVMVNVLLRQHFEYQSVDVKESICTY